MVFKSRMKVLKTMNEFYIVNPIKSRYRKNNVVEFFTWNICYPHKRINVYREIRDEENCSKTVNVVMFKRNVFWWAANVRRRCSIKNKEFLFILIVKPYFFMLITSWLGKRYFKKSDGSKNNKGLTFKINRNCLFLLKCSNYKQP